MVGPEPVAIPAEPATDPLVPAEQAPPRAEPVGEGERQAAVALLRGFALLGILAFFLPMFVWSIAGRTLPGMGLMKLGVFSGARSTRFYVRMALIANGGGLPPTVLGGLDLWGSGFDAVRGLIVGAGLGLLGTVPMVLGHSAVVLVVVKSGALAWLTRRLAAGGRMALTNSLLQSLSGTTLFYGYGLGLFGRVDRPGLWLIVPAI